MGERDLKPHPDSVPRPSPKKTEGSEEEWTFTFH